MPGCTGAESHRGLEQDMRVCAVLAASTHVDQGMLKDSVCEVRAESLLLAGVVSHVLQDGWTESRANRHSIQ